MIPHDDSRRGSRLLWVSLAVTSALLGSAQAQEMDNFTTSLPALPTHARPVPAQPTNANSVSDSVFQGRRLLNAWGPGTAATYIGTITGIYTGHEHTCGVTTAGEGLCWGSNADGQLNVPSGYKWSVIVAGPSHSCGVTEDGTGMCWGKAGSEVIDDFPSGNVWAIIWPASSHCCGITTSGAAICWGSDLYSKASVPSGHTWAEIQATGWSTCGLRVDGVADCWGYTSGGWNEPSGKVFRDISTGYHACGVTSSNEGLCWGRNNVNQADVPSGASLCVQMQESIAREPLRNN